MPREIALEAEPTAGIRRLSQHKAVIIDESDAEIRALEQSLEMGYAGTSHKNCKGIMKAVAHRDRDLDDIDGLLAAHLDLDLRRGRRWVQAFADALETPGLYDDLQKRLAGRQC